MTDIHPEIESQIIAEFSKEITISALPATGRDYTLKADEAALLAIAKRFDIPAVKTLSAAILVTPTKEGMDLKGHVQANLMRECVASLEALEEKIDDHFEICFDRNVADELPDLEDMDALEAFSKDKREPLSSDVMDIGEIVVQHVSLVMEPYPRLKGAKSLAESYGSAEEGSPFDILKQVITDE